MTTRTGHHERFILSCSQRPASFAAPAQAQQGAKKPNMSSSGRRRGRPHSAYSQASWATSRTSNALPKEGRCLPDATRTELHAGARRSSSAASVSHGLLTIGMPGFAARHPTGRRPIADLLKEQANHGPVGKNNLGDQDSTCDLARFDEFFGNLYHLNAKRNGDLLLPENPEFRKKYGPRGVLHCTRTQGSDVQHGALTEAHGNVDQKSTRPQTLSTRRREHKPFFSAEPPPHDIWTT